MAESGVVRKAELNVQPDSGFLFLYPTPSLMLGLKLGGSQIYEGFLVTQTVKNLPAMQETPVRSLGREDPLETGMTTHSCILAWEIPWTRGVTKSWTQLTD